MIVRFTFALSMFFIFSAMTLNAQKVNDNSAFKLPPSIVKTLEKNLNNCLLSSENCSSLKSVSSLSNEELDYYFSDYSSDAASKYAQLKSFGDNVNTSIKIYENKVDNITIENVSYRYGHSNKVKLADLSIYFHHKDHADIVNATFLISKDNEIYAVMLSK